MCVGGWLVGGGSVWQHSGGPVELRVGLTGSNRSGHLPGPELRSGMADHRAEGHGSGLPGRQDGLLSGARSREALRAHRAQSSRTLVEDRPFTLELQDSGGGGWALHSRAPGLWWRRIGPSLQSSRTLVEDRPFILVSFCFIRPKNKIT